MPHRVSRTPSPDPRRHLRRAARACIASALAGLSLFAASKAFAADTAAPVRPANRTEAVEIVAQARRIATPQGIERLEKVQVGSIAQWISIRGADRRNPVLLVVHGGPGYTSMPLAWWNARGWEDYFTVVHWDQRGAGRTHLLTDAAAVAPTLTLERMYADTEEVATWVRRELGVERIVVMGHSWGTYLGLRLAREHPGWLHAYVGVAQITDMRENERRNWRLILDKARRAGDAEAVAELEALAPYAADGDDVPMQHIYAQRRLGERFGGTLAYRDNNRAESALVRLAPEYRDDEVGRAWDGNEFAAPLLFREIIDIDLSREKRFEVPLLMFLGRHDTIANPGLVSEWLDGVSAPGKRVVWFEHSAHSPMTEEPGRFLVALVEHVHPLASQGGSAASP